MRASKRLLIIFVFLSLFLVISSLLAVWFYRPTPVPKTLAWASTQTGAPALATGRRPAAYNMLLVGRDRASAATDVMALLNLDADAGKLTVLQLPRDTLCRENGQGHKLNSVFAEKKRAAKARGLSDQDAEMDALLGLGAFLERALCVSIDYHALVYLDGFVELVDAVGGVTMEIPFPMHYDDPAQNLHIHLEKGLRHLSGAQAEQFIRFRKGNNGTGYPMGDLGRLDAQKQFATAMLRGVKESLTPAQLPALMRTLLTHTKSDLCLSDCVYFGKQVLSLSPDALTLVTLPGYPVGNDYVLNKNGTLALINKYFNVYAADIPPSAFDTAQIFNLPQDPAVDTKYHGKSPYIGASLHKSCGSAAKERNAIWNLHQRSLRYAS